MNPREFLVLGFEEIREDYCTPEFAKKYEGEGEKVELEGGRSVVLKLMTEQRYEGQLDLQLAFPKQFCLGQSPARKSIRLRSNQALAPDAA